MMIKKVPTPQRAPVKILMQIMETLTNQIYFINRKAKLAPIPRTAKAMQIYYSNLKRQILKMFREQNLSRRRLRKVRDKHHGCSSINKTNIYKLTEV